MKNIVYNCDCMEYMTTVEDNFFDLAIVDPPTGQGEDGGKNRRGIRHKKKHWDKKRPPMEYFEELFRISKNQIIWGAAYYIDYLKPGTGWICWDKKLDACDFGDFELAWTSFSKSNKIFRKAKTGGNTFKGMFINPCQKPIELYRWILQNYAQSGFKIFDSHIGSGSIRIACYDFNLDFIGCEIDKEYWKMQENRFKEYLKQGKLFEENLQDYIQPKISL